MRYRALSGDKGADGGIALSLYGLPAGVGRGFSDLDDASGSGGRLHYR